MRQIFHILLLISLAVLFVGCEREFDIEISAEESLFLQCFPGQRDTTVIQLSKTNPLGSVYDPSSIMNDAQIKFEVDGKEWTVLKAEEQTGSVFPGSWYVPGIVASCSTVKVSASCFGITSVSAITKVPVSVPEFRYTLTGDAVTVSFDDHNGDDTYFGLAVICERTVCNETFHDAQTVNMKMYDDAGDVGGMSYNRTYMDIDFAGLTVGGETGLNMVRVWSEDVTEDGKINLGARIYLDGQTVSACEGDYEEAFRYKIRVYRLSREFFLYAESLFLSSYSIHYGSSGGVSAPVPSSWGEYGLTPPVLSYTNVSNGFGALAGWSMRETDWIVLD